MVSLGLRGKLPPGDLSRILREIYGGGAVLGPSVGEDFAAFEVGGPVVVAHSDPITAAEDMVGWLSVHVACNDVATSGVRPRWLLVTVMARSGSTLADLEALARQVREAADEVGASVVGGHTEVTPWLDRTVVVSTALGAAGSPDDLIRTSGGRPGDAVILTKWAALEGTAVLAGELGDRLLESGVPAGVLERARGFIRKISVVRDAEVAVEAAGGGSGVHAMHDPTEGGVAAGLQELAAASGLGVEAWGERIPVLPETREICSALGVDPLRLLSSGSLLLAVDPGSVDRVVGALEGAGIGAAVIGRLLPDPGVAVIRRPGGDLDLTGPVGEEVWRVLG